ncbi:hypothetical protein [Streptomyces sp. NBC_00203]|uniref:hypothetical protein n=1 Tax=Streptomyces sp. NBC_00203 TaxID=2975680 RepID=UPI003245CA17
MQIVECESRPKGFYGHAVGDTRQGGPVGVTVPKDTTGPRLEERVTALLAELHESRRGLIAQDGTEVHQAGRAPGVPSWRRSGLRRKAGVRRVRAAHRATRTGAIADIHR